MNGRPEVELERLRKLVADAVRAHWKLFLIQGFFLMGLGLLAVALPHLSSLAVDILVGWLLFAGGLFRILTVLKSRHIPGYWWSLLTAVVALLLGIVLILAPVQGVLTLTLALIVLFAVEGVAAILVSLDFRHHLPNWGWGMLSGVVDLVLAVLIWQGWPSTAAWAIGLLFGINMFFLGLALVMTSIAARSMDGE